MSGLLLDTHAFIWSALQPDRLSRTAFEAIVDARNEVFISAVSVYEIEYKRGHELLFDRLPRPIAEAAANMGIGRIAVTAEDAELAAQLTRDHRDPWDRILCAQARNRGLKLVTADGRIHQTASAWRTEIIW